MALTSSFRHLLVTLVIVALPSLAWSQSYPDRPITLVVPYPAGAATDRIARSLGNELGKRLGQTVIVENVGGASGTLGGRRVVRAPADGYTLLLGTANDTIVAPIAMTTGYTAKDFTPIAKLSLNTTVLVAHPGFAANSVDELVAIGRKSKEPLLAGAAGAAMMQTIGGMLLAEAGGFKIDNVVYKGGAPLLNDLIAGQVQFGTVALPTALPLIRSGKLKALGVISAQRDPTAMDIPTVNEGRFVKGVEVDLWTGLFGPANLPEPVIDRLSDALRHILADQAYRNAEFRQGSVVAEFAPPASFRTFLENEDARMRPIMATVKAE
jgi:tripartite-type tricarboxylate transporter receptor subunit TctC